MNYDAIYRRYLMPCHHWMRGRKRFHYWQKALESQWMSRDALREQRLWRSTI